MTGQAYFELFSKAMRTKRIIRYDNEASRDHYHTYAIRETPTGYLFFCLLETFFRREKNADIWIPGSLTSYHEFGTIQGAEESSLILTTEIYYPRPDYKKRLPISDGFGEWITVD